jgi:hypothetical protein
MTFSTASAFVGLPVRLHGIQLGRIADVLLDPEGRRALGFDVRCGDDASRFLPWVAVKEFGPELTIDSALPLLADVAFYRRRAHSFRSLVEGARADEQVRDFVLAADGAVTAVIVVSGSGEERRAPDGLSSVGSGGRSR